MTKVTGATPMSQDAVPYHVDRLDDPTRDPTRAPWPDPTPEMRTSPQFEAVWQCIRTWDIHVPDAYTGSMGATGNHVRAILDALAPFLVTVEQLTLRPDPSSVLVVTLSAGQTDHVYESTTPRVEACPACGLARTVGYARGGTVGYVPGDAA